MGVGTAEVQAGVCDPTVGGAQWARARSAYSEHEAHFFDVGCVPAQWLVESMQLSDLPSQKGACSAGRGVRARRGVGGRGVVEMGGGEMQVERVQCGHGRVAHIEHGRNVCDAGRVPAQRLVKRRRSLPRVERGIYTVRGESCGSGEVSKSLGGGSASKRTVRLQLGRSGHGIRAPRTCRTWL